MHPDYDSLTSMLDAVLGHLTSNGLMRDGVVLSEDNREKLNATFAYLGLDPTVVRLDPDQKYRVDPIHGQLLRHRIEAARQALAVLKDQGVEGQPILKYFIDTDDGLAQDYPQLQSFLNNTRLLAVVQHGDDHELSLHTTTHTRNEVVDAINQVCPLIAVDIRAKMEAAGMNGDESGTLPMSKDQIEEFRNAYRRVAHTMLDKGFEAAQERIGKLYAQRGRAAERILRPQVTVTFHEAQSRGIGYDKAISSKPGESVDTFLLPLEVLKPIRDTMRRVESLLKPGHDGIHEKFRTATQEAWLGYHDRTHMVSRAKQLQEMLKDNPKLKELQEKGVNTEITCVTVYTIKDAKKTHAERQSLDKADETPLLPQQIRNRVEKKETEYWMAIPQDLLPLIAEEQKDFRELRDGARDHFIAALALEDGEERQKQMDKADADLQAIIDDYVQRGVLRESFEVKSLRQNPINVTERVSV